MCKNEYPKTNRSALRGKPLDDDCKKANTTTHEMGMKDNRVFCYGLYAHGGMSDDIDKKCLSCGAYVFNNQ